jgi:hypothetical protein
MTEPAREATRAEFEKWAAQKYAKWIGVKIERHGRGYDHPNVDDDWTAWQAAIDRHFPGYKGWISVEERLPGDSDGLVLAYLPPNILGTAWINKAFGDGKTLFWPDQEEDREAIGVTHWMPLPDPPTLEAVTRAERVVKDKP